jgi:flagellar assembly factor FliW
VDEQDMLSSASANTEALIFSLLEINRLLNAELNALFTLAPIIFNQIKKRGFP